MAEVRSPIREFVPSCFVEESSGNLELTTVSVGDGWQKHESSTLGGLFYYQMETDISGLVRQGKTLFPQYVTASLWTINHSSLQHAGGDNPTNIVVYWLTTKLQIDPSTFLFGQQFAMGNQISGVSGINYNTGSFNNLVAYNWQAFTTSTTSPIAMIPTQSDSFGTMDPTAGEKLYHTVQVYFRCENNVTSGVASLSPSMIEIGQVIDKEPKLEHIYRLKRSYEVEQ